MVAGKLQGLRQTVFISELHALLHVARHMKGDVTYWTDHINIVRAISPAHLPTWKRGKTHNTKTSDNKHMWEEVLQAIRAPGCKLEAIWVNSHAGQLEDRAPDIPSGIYEGNDLADDAAKKAAAEHGVPDHVVEDL